MQKNTLFYANSPFHALFLCISFVIRAFWDVFYANSCAKHLFGIFRGKSFLTLNFNSISQMLFMYTFLYWLQECTCWRLLNFFPWNFLSCLLSCEKFEQKCENHQKIKLFPVIHREMLMFGVWREWIVDFSLFLAVNF